MRGQAVASRSMLCLDSPEETDLLERTAELNVLREAVRRAAAGRGAAVLLDAPAGLGKTALLEHAAGFADDAGALVRRAAPSLAERDFAYGVVRALLETPARALP